MSNNFPDTQVGQDSPLGQEDLIPDPEDLSSHLPSPFVPVPSLKPVLDSKDIFCSLALGHSPRGNSLDGESESVVSDYSELGGTLRDMEQDVHYLDKEALRDQEILPSYDVAVHACTQEVMVRRQEETEDEFEWRVRKMNLLSLAQEFAQLKKLDSQACPINFHRNQSSKVFTRGCSPLGSRCQSLERASRRTHSRSPMRTTRFSSRDLPRNLPSMDREVTSYYTLPKNLERQLLSRESTPAEDGSLPVNEARRRLSNTEDLPANMRPERHSPSLTQVTAEGGTQHSQQLDVGRSLMDENKDWAGDFEIYNMETALTHMGWQQDESSLLEACRKEREAIRRRLALTEEEDRTPTADTPLSPWIRCHPSSSQDQSPSWGGATPGMQICFMTEDMLEDQENLMQDSEENQSSSPAPSQPCLADKIQVLASRQNQLQTEATLALAQASTMARMQLEVDKQTKKKSPIADMVGIPSLGSGRRLHIKRSKLQEMNIAQLQVLVNDLHSQIELLNEDLVHLLIERDDLHMEQDSMLVDIEDLTSHCQDPVATNNNKSTLNNNMPGQQSRGRFK